MRHHFLLRLPFRSRFITQNTLKSIASTAADMLHLPLNYVYCFFSFFSLNISSKPVIKIRIFSFVLCLDLGAKKDIFLVFIYFVLIYHQFIIEVFAYVLIFKYVCVLAHYTFYKTFFCSQLSFFFFMQFDW